VSKQITQPTLQGRHVFLRTVTPEDYRFLQIFETSGDLGVQWRFRGRTPSPEQWAQMTWMDVLAQFLVIGRASNLPLGVVAIYEPNFQDGHAKLAAARFDSGKRSPPMMIGVALFLRYAFTCWNLRKLYLELPEYNYAQFASGLDRVFRVEGRLREHYYFGGERWDQIVLAIYREQWQRYGEPLLRAETLDQPLGLDPTGEPLRSAPEHVQPAHEELS
jgi:hypothetical protein